MSRYGADVRKATGCLAAEVMEETRIWERGVLECVRRIMDLSITVMSGAIRLAAEMAEVKSIARRRGREEVL